MAFKHFKVHCGRTDYKKIMMKATLSLRICSCTNYQRVGTWVTAMPNKDKDVIKEWLRWPVVSWRLLAVLEEEG